MSNDTPPRRCAHRDAPGVGTDPLSADPPSRSIPGGPTHIADVLPDVLIGMLLAEPDAEAVGR